MKRKYLLLMVSFSLSTMLFLSGCNSSEVGEESLISNVQDNITEDSYKGKDNNTEKNQVAKNREEDKIERVVEPGYENIEKFLDEEYANKAFQGVALVAKGDDIKFAKAYGYADVEENRENTLSTRFAIASNTKQFTAAAVMQLIEKNKINLDQTIDKYFPDYKYGSQITIRSLLQMRSGMPDYLNEVELYFKDDESKNILKEYENTKYFDKYVEDKRWNKDIIIRNLNLTDLHSEPNAVYDYCNTNYYLLGLIIEKESGMTYEEYIEKKIFEPTKMTTSSMKMEEGDARGHGSPESGKIVANPNFTYAAGNIYSNVFDMLRWNRMLHKGDIISRESYIAMTTPVDNYGYGVFVEDGIIRHSGVIDGFNSNT
ncbi:serine hydrolase domain-containing protein, partial [Clostridium sp.]|uniref:serine hydrolase domain-containing protein n=1 Tax=Clostridium sp. TaxID=1506 RepID=UPI003F3BF5D1